MSDPTEHLAEPVPNTILGSNVVVGRIDASSTLEQLRVDYIGNKLGALHARTTLTLPADAIAHAVASNQGALLLFENSDPRLPIIVGLIQTPERNAFQALLAPRHVAEQKAAREAHLDGERVVLEAQREIVLKCGEASLTLRRDGKVLIRGAYVETHSKGVNRIKGGSVKIN